MRYLTILFLTAALTSVASAELTAEVAYLTPEQDDNLDYYGINIADNCVGNRISITTNGDWLSAELLVVPDDPGMIFQYPWSPYDSSPESPDPNLIEYGAEPFVPPLTGLAYDTFLSSGVLGESVKIGGGAYFLGGAEDATFNTDLLDICWFTNDPDDLGTLALAMVTLDKSATGTWGFYASTCPLPTVLLSGDIVDGKLVPEPGTIGMFALGGLGLLRRRCVRV